MSENDPNATNATDEQQTDEVETAEEGTAAATRRAENRTSTAPTAPVDDVIVIK